MKAFGLIVVLLIAGAIVEAKNVIVKLEAPALVHAPGFSRSWLVPRGLSSSSSPSKRMMSTRAEKSETALSIERQQEDFIAGLSELNNKKRSEGQEQFKISKVRTEDGDIEARFSILVNALVINIGETNEQEAINSIRQIKHVVSVEKEHTYVSNLYVSLDEIAVHSAWATLNLGGLQYPGKGIKLAIVDSGLWINASMFNNSDNGIVWPTDIPAPGLGETANCNGKIIVSRKYMDLSQGIPEVENHTWPFNSSGCHGMHTGSTAGGRHAVGTLGMVSQNITGVAPYSWLMNYKIISWNAAGEVGASDSSIMVACEDLVADGAQIMSNSWGSSEPFVSTSFYGDLVQAVQDAGVFVVSSAGNSGPDHFTTNWPNPALRVAAITTQKYVSGSLVSDPPMNPYTYQYATSDFALQPPESPTTFTLVAPNETDIEACTNFTGKYDFTGKAVLIMRGTCYFNDKARIAHEVGAGMVIIYNNEAGGEDFFTMGGDGIDFLDIPVVFIGYIGGSYLKQIAYNTTNPTVTIDGRLQSTPFPQNIVAKFSSRGPTADMILSPDISAPGVSIFAAGFPRDGYTAISGTSMACPHVSGVATLVLQKNPTFTPEELKSAIMSTADWKELTLHDGITPAQPLDCGAGVLNASRAINPTFFLSPQALSFGLVERGTPKSISVKIKSYATTGSRNIKFQFQIHTGKGIAVDAPAYFTTNPTTATIAAGETITVQAILNPATAGFGDNQAYLMIRDSTTNEDLATMPAWGRVVCNATGRVQVLLIDADFSQCGIPSTSDYRSDYEEALNRSGLTYKTVEVDCELNLPSEVEMMCFDTVLMFSGDVNADTSSLATILSTVAFAEKPIILFGALSAYNFAPTGTSSTTFLYYTFRAYFTAVASTASIKPSASGPSKFSNMTNSFSTFTYFSRTYDFSERLTLLVSSSNIPLVTSYFDMPSTEFPKPWYNTLGLVSLIDIGTITSAEYRSKLLNLLFDHATEKFSSCALTTSASGLQSTLNLGYTSGYDNVIIAWGDASSKTAFQSAFTQMHTFTHNYPAVGNYSCVVAVQTSLGRVFTKELTIEITSNVAPVVSSSKGDNHQVVPSGKASETSGIAKLSTFIAIAMTFFSMLFF